tara:strand:- start:487 stop:885 length:399 start_codon:yes stop_codon:yes gene_type:complete
MSCPSDYKDIGTIDEVINDIACKTKDEKTKTDLFNEKQLLYQQKYNKQTHPRTIQNSIYFLLIILYYVCILVVFYYIYTKFNLNRYQKIGIFILLISYPFLINLIQTYIYYFADYGWILISGNSIDNTPDKV